MVEIRSATETRTLSDLPDLLEHDHKPRSRWIRVLCVIGAVLLFALGVVGWLIPLVTGIPFYVAGLFLLSSGSDRARQLINRLERKLPHGWRMALRRVVRRKQPARTRPPA